MSCLLFLNVDSARAQVIEESYSTMQPSASAPAPSPPYQLPAREETWGDTRVLGGHSFLRGTFVPTALVLSQASIRAGLQYHRVPAFVQLPSLVEDEMARPANLSTVNVGETLELSFRLHDYLAIFGDVYGTARVGANTATLLGTGVDYRYGGDLGLLAKLFRYKSFQLAVSAQIGGYSGQGAGILALFQDLSAIARNTIDDVQNDPSFDEDRAIRRLNQAFRTATADLLTPFSGFSYGFALNAAQAIGRYVGVQGSVGFYGDRASYQPTRYDETVGGPVTSQYKMTTIRPAFGLAVDVDANPAHVPIAAMLEYRVTPTFVTDTGMEYGSANSVEHLLALGLYYSGRTDLQLGLTGYTSFGQTPMFGANATPSGNPLDLAVQLVFRYFW